MYTTPTGIAPHLIPDCRSRKAAGQPFAPSLSMILSCCTVTTNSNCGLCVRMCMHSKTVLVNMCNGSQTHLQLYKPRHMHKVVHTAVVCRLDSYTSRYSPLLAAQAAGSASNCCTDTVKAWSITTHYCQQHSHNTQTLTGQQRYAIVSPTHR